MRCSEMINDLATALAAAQGEMGNAILNRVNPHFKSKYADFAAVREATLPSLSKHGLAITQCTTLFDHDGSFILVTRLMHSGGQWMESVYPLPMLPDKPQIMGSAQTYARRYSWAGICGIASEEDDDANTAQAAAPQNGQRTTRGPDWGKSAQAKRRGDWGELENDLLDCGSAIAVAKLQTDYRANQYPRWSKAWQEQAEELFAKRWADFTGDAPGEALTLREQLQGSVKAEPLPGEPTTRADYIRLCHDVIDEMGSQQEIDDWWEVQAAARKRYRLSPAEESDMKTRAKERLKTIRKPAQTATFVPNARERAEAENSKP